MDKQTLGPGRNPFGGPPDSNGIYVVRPTGDFTIRNSRVLGTLVIICPAGKKVIVDSEVLLQPARTDLPALIIKGDADIQFVSGTNTFTESEIGISLNPNGVPYNGIENISTSEAYPSEIQGLVHVTGKVNLKQTSLIRGALISNSTATLLSNAVAISDTPT